MCLKTLRKIQLAAIASLCFVATSYSQNTFRISYDVDPLYDMPGGIVESASGNYVFGGGLLLGSITEVDPTGVVNWSESYSEGTTVFSDIIKVGANYIIAGSSGNNMLLAESSSTGVISWGKKYNTTNGTNEYAAQVKQLASGDYIIAGNVEGFDPDGGGAMPAQDSSNFYIVKTNSAGVVLWDKIILPTTAFDNDHYLTDVAEVADGYIFVGRTSENGTASSTTDAVVLKTDVNGNLLWLKKLGTGGVDDGFESVNSLSSGEVLIGGFIGEDAAMIRVNSAGTSTWAWTYNDPDFLKQDITVGYNAFQTSDGNYACVGTYIDVLTFVAGINGGSLPMMGTFLIKVNPSVVAPNNNIIFQKFYQNGLSALMPDGIQTSDGGYALTMMAQEMAPLTGFNYHMVKTDLNGDAGASCDMNPIGLVNSGYTPSFAAITPTVYSGTTTSAFVPVTNTPTPAVGAICCSVPDPTTGTATPATICVGQSSTITASGSSPGVTYNVYDAASGGNLLGATPLSVSPGSTTTYYVEAVSDIGCLSANRVAVTVTVNSAPTVSVDIPSATICQGDNITITATGAGGAGAPYTYSWSSGPTTAGITVSPASTTTYTVTTNDGVCSSSSASSVITVVPPITASISGGTSSCNNEMITLTAAPSGGTYLWSTGATTETITVNPQTNTTYTVDVTVGTCSDNASQLITVLTSPTASIAGGDVCAGNSTTLTASGGNSYVWSTTETTPAISVSPVVNTTYTVIASGTNGCSDTAQYTVNVNALPSVSVTTNPANGEICDGASATLTAAGAGGSGSGYTYDWITTSETTTAITVTPTATTNYDVQVTDGLGCTSTVTSTSITVNPIPDVSASSDVGTTVCDGSTVVLTGSSSNDPQMSYTWDNGVTDGVGFTPPAGTVTTYTVTGTNSVTGCQNTTTIDINSTVPPVAGINGVANGSTTACSNETTTLTATPAGGIYLWSTGETTQSIDVMPTAVTVYSVTVSIGTCSDNTSFTISPNTAPTASVSSTGNNLVCTGTNDTITISGGVTYHWIETGETTASIVVTPTATESYTGVVIDGNGCSDTLVYTVNVNPLPTVGITGTDTICNGSSTTLTGTGASTYVWSTAETTTSITVSPTLNNTYTVVGTDANGCENTSSITVVVMAPPSAAITGDTVTCTGQPVTLTAAGGNNYIWNTGATTPQITVSPGTTTVYTVVALVGTCSDTANYTVNVTAPPIVSAGVDTTIIIGQGLNLNASGATEYSWDNSDVECQTCASTYAEPTETTVYCVIGEANGCIDTACVTVTVDIKCGEVFVPNAFSPNGDGVNDCLEVYNNCLESIVFRLYDRWGEKIYESVSIEDCWDGTYKGQPLNTATFAYVLEYTLIDGTSGSQKGNVSLIK